MSIQIHRERELLHVSGSIETILTIPHSAVSGAETRFTLALSDGTLVEGVLDGEDCRFEVSVAGAGLTHIGGSRGPALRHDWAIEWITISAAHQIGMAEKPADELPLFPDLAPAEPEMPASGRLRSVMERLISRQ